MPAPSLAIDNLRIFAVAREAAGATLCDPPRYALDLHPTETPSSKFKAPSRNPAQRSVPGGRRATASMPRTVLEICAVALCIGNPAYASEVGLACHPVKGTLGAASHCGLFVYSGRQIRAQYSIGFFGTEFNTDPEVMRVDRATFSNGNVYPVRAPEGRTQKAFAKSVIDWAGRYRAPYYDLMLGPNSNSGVGFPLIMSGAELPNVQQGVLGAWGLGYWSFLKGSAAGPAAPNVAVVRRARRIMARNAVPPRTPEIARVRLEQEAPPRP
jgi:hypothetical protein